MNKGQSQNTSFVTRTGSFATHASRTGRNLLGWEEDEIMSPTEQLDALKKVVSELQSQLTELNAELKATVPFGQHKAKHKLREELKARFTEVSIEIAQVRKLVPDRQEDLGHFIIELMRERLTKPEWDILIREAQRRFDAQ